MDPDVLPATVKTADLVSRPSRAERLLGGMHKVFSHDLPNQLVVIQSLVSLMELEEKDRLSGPAQEYLTRLAGAAQRAGIMVQFLKQMAGLNVPPEEAEEIQLLHLGREIQAELKTMFPDNTLVHECHWEVPVLRCGRRSLHQAVLEVIRCGIDCCRGCKLRVGLGSRPRETGTLLDIVVGPTEIFNGRHEPLTVDHRLELRLARELLAGWSGTLEIVIPAEGTYAFQLVIPSRDEGK